MKDTSLRTAESVLAEQLKDPEFRTEWERTAPARAVATQLSAFRTDHGLSQTQLATRLGVSQAYIAELERGEHNPRLETLTKLSSKLGIEFVLSIAPGPGTRRSPWLSSSVKDAPTLETGLIDGSRVVIAARPRVEFKNQDLVGSTAAATGTYGRRAAAKRKRGR